LTVLKRLKSRNFSITRESGVDCFIPPTNEIWGRGYTGVSDKY